MQISEALQILGLHSNHVTEDEIKTAYRRKATEYHPDINPVGLHMMQIINNAYETLKKFKGPLINTLADMGINPCLEEAIKAVICLEGLEVEICGLWIWISGKTGFHKDALKDAHYKWAPAKKMWYFRPDHHSANKKNTNPFSMEEIRQKFGSKTVPAFTNRTESTKEALKYFYA